MKRYVISIGLAIGSGLGLAGSFVPSGVLQNTLWEISGIGLAVGCLLLAASYARKMQDELAVGFALLALAEGVMSSGTAAGISAGQPAFAAGTALYVPALLLISLPKNFAIWVRIAGIISSVVFAIVSLQIFLGNVVSPVSPLPSGGYAFLTIAVVGWIISVLRTT